MGGFVEVRFISNEIDVKDVIDIKDAAHLCRSYDFLYPDGDIKKQFELFKQSAKILKNITDEPTYGPITIDHIQGKLISEQTHFDIKEYCLDIFELICPDIVDYSSNAIVPNPRGKLILSNLLEMVNKRKFAEIKSVKYIYGEKIFDGTQIFKTVPIPEQQWNKENWKDFILSNFPEESMKDSRNFIFDIPPIVDFIQKFEDE